MQSLRERSGCRFFERRTDAAALKAAMCDTGLLLGLLTDQHAGDGGLRLPFLNHGCSTSAAPAIFALRYHCPLHTAICYRTGLAQWRIEAGDEISTRENGRPRSGEDIMRDVNRAFEAAVRRDPANWFWVHNRWKSTRQEPKVQRPELEQPTKMEDEGLKMESDATQNHPPSIQRAQVLKAED
jgi:KDO2-lipid IV(A) lauroyltransferase